MLRYSLSLLPARLRVLRYSAGDATVSLISFSVHKRHI